MPRIRSQMGVVLPVAPDQYDRRDQSELRRLLEQAFQQASPAQDKPIVTGAKGGSAVLTSIMAALVELGLVVDQTT